MFNDSNLEYNMPTKMPWLALAGAGEPPSPPKRRICYDYPRPAYTADTVIFNGASVLLVRRGKDPFKGKLALPGGFVNEFESSLEAAKRELVEETGLIINSEPKLVGIYDKPGRDPRGWVITSAYRTRTKQLHVQAGDDATEAFFVPLNKLGKELLSFDHWTIINDAWEQESNFN